MRSEYCAAAPQRMHTACILSTYSAIAMSSGIGPKGRRRKSRSSPATITRTPRSASSVTSSTSPPSKNWASSMPTTSTPRLSFSRISPLDVTVTADRLRLSRVVSTSPSPLRVSVAIRNTWTRWRAIRARRSRRTSSSLLPENMPPVITSMQPPSPRPCSRIMPGPPRGAKGGCDCLRGAVSNRPKSFSTRFDDTLGHQSRGPRR